VTSFNVYEYEFERKGFVHLGWEYVGYDIDFAAYNLYRQAVGETTPTLLASFSELRPSYGYRDYSAKSNTTYTYWVTQTVNRFGDIVESLAVKTVQVKTPASNYWLLDSIGAVDPVPIFQVTSDSFVDEHEEAVVNVIGRGRHVDIGQKLGVSGTLSCQCRDKFVGYTEGHNWVPNASLQYAADGLNPDGWTVTGYGTAATFTGSYDTYYEPNPAGKYNVFSWTVDDLAPGSANHLDIQAPDIKISDTDFGGQYVTVGVWLAIPPTPAQTTGIIPSITAIQLDTDETTVLSTTTSTPSGPAEVYEPAASGDANAGNWKRYVATFLIGASSKYLRITVSIKSTVDAAYTIYMGGLSVNTGQSAIPYFDGDSLGCQWVTSPGSASYSPGLYTGRDQATDISYMKELERALYLRNPFGDIYLVSIGDESTDRMAGVGSNDFRDLQVPYREVAF
jgi:hypothetical protein